MEAASLVQSSAQALFNSAKTKTNEGRAYSNSNRLQSTEESIEDSTSRISNHCNIMDNTSGNSDLFGFDYYNYRSLTDLYDRNDSHKSGGLGDNEIHNSISKLFVQKIF